MNLRAKIQYVLREAYGPFNSFLENKYSTHLTKKLISDDKNKWITYNQVVLELKHNIKDSLRVEELQYKLTDIEYNPNEACIQILEAVELNPELERLYYKIKNF